MRRFLSCLPMLNRRRIVLYMGSLAAGITAVELGWFRPIEWIATALGNSPLVISFIVLLLVVGGWLGWLTVGYLRLANGATSDDGSPAE